MPQLFQDLVGHGFQVDHRWPVRLGVEIIDGVLIEVRFWVRQPVIGYSIDLLSGQTAPVPTDHTNLLPAQMSLGENL